MRAFAIVLALLGATGAAKAAEINAFISTAIKVGNPVQRGHRFQGKADSNPVIADSR